MLWKRKGKVVEGWERRRRAGEGEGGDFMDSKQLVKWLECCLGAGPLASFVASSRAGAVQLEAALEITAVHETS